MCVALAVPLLYLLRVDACALVVPYRSVNKYTPVLYRQVSRVMAWYPGVRIVADFFDLTSMKLMNQRYFDWSLPPSLWPPFTSGSVFCSSLLDPLLCQVRALSALYARAVMWV